MNDTAKLPRFKYHPNLYENEIIVFKSGICQCCGEKVYAYIESMYCEEEVDCICLHCIANGKAAEKFHGDFIQSVENKVSDSERTNELRRRTPGYISWQGEYWLTCCDDYCAYIGTVGTKELKGMGIHQEVFMEYEERNEYASVQEYLVKDGSLCGYLFQCLYCGKYHLWVDAD